jgi:hypothetical protein
MKEAMRGAVLSLFIVACAFAGPIEDLKPGEWCEVPDSRLESVAASEKDFPWLSGGIYGITACWAGGAFDSQRDRLYVGPGGGHAGYNGNEIYAFDLNDLKWHRLNDPDPVIPGTEYTDLNKAPFAMHTYDGVEYIPPPVDRYIVIGGWGTPRTYALDPDHPNKWEVYADHGTGRTGDICAFDPVGGMLWLSTPSTAGKLSQYEPISHQWTLRRRDSPDATYYETADVDWRRRLLVSCGHGKVKTWHLAPTPEKVEYLEVATTGGDVIVKSSSPGFCYVPLLDKFVAWQNGTDVYTLDMDSKKWTRHEAATTNKVTPGPADQWGTFGRFRYVASKSVFVVYNHVKQNVFIYRLDAGKPNVITAVKATAMKKAIDSDVPAGAIKVEAVYADGTKKDVTKEASYFSLDEKTASIELHGGGVVTGLAAGKAKVRAVYSDPAFKRGFADEVAMDVKDIVGEAKLESVTLSYLKLTLIEGDRFQLEATAAYTRGKERFTRRVTGEAKWTSDSADVAAVTKGLIEGKKVGGPAKITAVFKGMTQTAEVAVADGAAVRRIHFQVTDKPPREGWFADNGQKYDDARGFGWIKPDDLATRDDRNSAKRELWKAFVKANEKPFKVKVPAGEYSVRIAMGDSDYGGGPFEEWTALGDQKLIYGQGHGNKVETRIVKAGDDGLVFTVKGPINYLIVAPVGVDLEKHAGDE